MKTDHSGLYHVSEQPGIDIFAPRSPSRDVPGIDSPVVWAVDREHLCSYLLPRDCPRVTYRAGAGTSAADVEKFLGGDPLARVVAIESGWLHRAGTTELTVYVFDPSGFRILDPAAGYYVSSSTVIPLEEISVNDAARAIHSMDAELHVLDSLWDLRDEVIGSSLEYSIIRMANAEPPGDPSGYHPLPGSEGMAAEN